MQIFQLIGIEIKINLMIRRNRKVSKFESINTERRKKIDVINVGMIGDVE